ncbi:MAG: ArsR/SmtB family transcription factor [Thermodesulfobacteriota bacterium]
MNVDSSTANVWADILKALAHPTRVQIVAELLRGTKCVTDMQDILPARQANVSQHLAVLRYARLVDFTQKGSQRCYFLLRPELIDGVLQHLSAELKQPEAVE